jgi:hypothetical protein
MSVPGNMYYGALPMNRLRENKTHNMHGLKKKVALNTIAIAILTSEVLFFLIENIFSSQSYKNYYLYYIF